MEEGTDGFIAAVNATESGSLKISGFDPVGSGPGNDLHILTIYWTAGSGSGTTVLEIIIDALTDENTNTIGDTTGINGLVKVVELTLGDVNRDGEIDIIDALLVAQYYIDLIDSDALDILSADVDASGEVDIVDALLIAQKYVGIIDSFPGVL